ncbi:TetR/AcrR family transcriptional regulator [Sinisalibacter aestuarii]|uniref:TetR family transcriptional regulator n=1 Tax=Sinisalibacter aestuarii TaxID=2949426 RepID=A0ABQ5LVS3_9RHOB|nr:TetR/AcrR family transcriptional regulator [Sinisalibacter aestuarii]GKY89087.1 TetR family transcriptional regulator [Sinisalibacter aestuarii]
MPRGIARDHDQKREAIRKGAAEYFARHGFDRASMTGAAKHCGVSKALIYHYYSAKEALLYDILDWHLTDLVETAREVSPEGGLGALICAILEAYEDADAEHKLQIDALSVLPDAQQAPLIALQRELVEMMSAALLHEAPALDGTDKLRPVTMSVFGILNWFYMWHRPGKGMDRKAYARLATDMVLNGIRGV